MVRDGKLMGVSVANKSLAAIQGQLPGVVLFGKVTELHHLLELLVLPPLLELDYLLELLPRLDSHCAAVPLSCAAQALVLAHHSLHIRFNSCNNRQCCLACTH